MLADPEQTGAAARRFAAPAGSRSQRIVTALAVALLAGVGLWLRVDGARPVVLPEGAPVRLLGTDAYDHLRRAAELTGTLPAELAPRPVSEGDWVRPGLFDALLALPAWAHRGGSPALPELMAGAAWVPPALGALSIVALFALSRRFMQPLDAAFTALLYVLYPGESLDRTTLGFADHHAAEILLTLLTLGALVRQLQSHHDRPWWRPEFSAATPALGLLLIWRGAPMTLVLVALGLVLTALTEVLAGRSVERLARQSLRYALGLGVLMGLATVLMPALLLGPVTTRRGWFAVLALLSVGGIAWLMAATRRRRPGGAGPWLVVAGLGSLALAAVALPAGRRALELVIVARTATVLEHADVDAGTSLASLGAVALLVLPGLALGLLAVLRRRLDPLLVVPLVVATGWGAIWWRIHDVGYLLPALLALPAGCALWSLRSWLMQRVARTRRPRERRLAGVLSVVPAIVLAVAPIWPYGIAAAPRTSIHRAQSLLVYRSAHTDAAIWLRDHTPQGAGHPVASPWALGNLVATLGERRPLWARMPTPAAGAWLLAQSEEESLDVLAAASEGDEVLYAVIDGRSCGSYFVAAAQDAGIQVGTTTSGTLKLGASEVSLWRFDATYTDSLAARLCFGQEPELIRHRLRWESSSRVVTTYRMSGLSGTADASGGSGNALQLRLETRPLAAGERLPLPTQVEVSADDRSVAYGARVHAEVRVFEIVPPPRVEWEPAGRQTSREGGLDQAEQ